MAIPGRALTHRIDRRLEVPVRDGNQKSGRCDRGRINNGLSTTIRGTNRRPAQSIARVCPLSSTAKKSILELLVFCSGQASQNALEEEVKTCDWANGEVRISGQAS